ncbi:MAG: hypothetical protein HC888_17640 [Candidatus Competibacteraceae bacterium]|nr:hypothetical protein [Candidatus Competibacteraceae bacterium]
MTASDRPPRSNAGRLKQVRLEAAGGPTGGGGGTARASGDAGPCLRCPRAWVRGSRSATTSNCTRPQVVREKAGRLFRNDRKQSKTWSLRGRHRHSRRILPSSAPLRPGVFGVQGPFRAKRQDRRRSRPEHVLVADLAATP